MEPGKGFVCSGLNPSFLGQELPLQCQGHIPGKISRGADHLAELRLLYFPQVRYLYTQSVNVQVNKHPDKAFIPPFKKGLVFEQLCSPWAEQALSAQQPMQTRSDSLK